MPRICRQNTRHEGMAPRKKKAKVVAQDVDTVLKEVRRVRAQQSVKPKEEVDLTGVRVVSEMTAQEVTLSIEELFVLAAESIMKGESFKFEVPSRSASNQAYIPALDRVVLKANTSERSFANVSQSRKTAVMARVLSLVHEVVGKAFT